MKNLDDLRGELLSSINPSISDMNGIITHTTNAIVEYIDDAIEQWGDTPPTGQVLMMLRNNVLQFAGNQ